MNLSGVLAELRAERELVSQAIASLERLSGDGKHRRGRPSGAHDRRFERTGATHPEAGSDESAPQAGATFTVRVLTA